MSILTCLGMADVTGSPLHRKHGLRDRFVPNCKIKNDSNTWWMQASDLVKFPCQMPCWVTIKCTVCAITRPFVLHPQHVIKPHYSLTPKLGESNRELCNISIWEQQ